MTLEIVDRLTSPPIVGQYYLVPTVEWKWYSWVRRWPVIGPRHNDEQFFKFPLQHHHIDARFVRINEDFLLHVFSAPLAAQRGDYNGTPPSIEYRRRISYSVSPFRQTCGDGDSAPLCGRQMCKG